MNGEEGYLPVRGKLLLRQTRYATAFLEKGEPLRERSPQHSVSTKGLGPCASQPGGPFSSRTAVESNPSWGVVRSG